MNDEDIIYRQDAIDALKICDNNEDGINCHKCPLRDERWDGAWEDDETNCYTKLMRDSAKLLEMPSAEPRKKGKWIPLQLPIAHPLYQCSCCSKNAPMVETGSLVNRYLEALLTDFCPNCGADMREGEEG